MAGYVGGAPPPPPSRRDVLSEKFPEAVASGRVQLDREAPSAGDGGTSAPGAPQGGYKVRTLAEQVAENRRKTDEDFMDEYKPKGPKALDDEEFEFIEGTQLARLKRRLLEEAEEKDALADFHARKATLVHNTMEVLLIAKPDVPDVVKKSLAPAAPKAKPSAPAFKITAVAKGKPAESTFNSTSSALSSSSPATPSSSSTAQPPAKTARSAKESPSSPVTAAPAPTAPKVTAAPAAPAGLAMLGAYANSDEEG